MPGYPIRSLIIIGGGITGLAAAHRVRELHNDLQVTLLEASSRLGGVLHTERRDGYLLESSADNFITNLPWGIDLCRRLGLEHELLPTRPEDRRALVVHRGRLKPVPESFVLMAPHKLWPVLTTPILSWRGKLRLMAECLVPRRRGASDESLASFATRRLGREVFERLVQPLIGGIYTADAEQLSLAATLPRFLEMERRHGSLIRAALFGGKNSHAERSGQGARYGLFVAPRRGMESLVEALAATLPADSIRRDAPVARVAPEPSGGWSVELRDEAATRLTADAVVLATPAPASAAMLAQFDPTLSAELAAIPYASSALALVGYRRDQFDRPPPGFGFVVPDIERREILAASFSSNKYPERADEAHVLIRVFLGGARRPELVEAPEETLRAIVLRELTDLLGVRGEPELFELRRWRGVMPQYHLGHLERVARIMSRAESHRGFMLCGNAYHGVGVPNCIHDGEQAVERLLNREE